MPMSINYPTTTNPCPPTFTAWGGYSTADSPSGGVCRMKRNGTVIQTIPLNAANFRPDGVWIADFSGLAEGTDYECSAEYTPGGGGGAVGASPQDPVEVAALAPVIPPPPQMSEPPPSPTSGPPTGPIA